MDIKTSIEKYPEIAPNIPEIGKSVKESILYILQSGIHHEFRTTAVPDIVTTKDMWQICQLIEKSEQYTIAQYNPEITLDPLYKNVTPYNTEELQELAKIPKHLGILTRIRS